MTSNSRRIAVCLPSLRAGGAERVALNLVEGLLDRSCQVDVVVGRGEGPLASELPRAARVVDLGATRMARAIWPLASYFRAARPQAAISHVHHLNAAAALARSLAGIALPLVLVEHNTLGEKARGGQVRFGLTRALRCAYTRRDTRVVAVSHGVADSLAGELRLRRDAIDVIANPVIGARFDRLSPQPIAHRWSADRSAPLVLGVGRLVPQKDFATLLSAFAILRARRPARLLILGDGPLRGELEAQRKSLACAADIELTGFVANPLPYYRIASVAALSSRFEGLPTVLIEALASGCPCVATDCPSGPREILDNGSFGALTPVGDAASLAAALESELNRHWDRAALVARGREFSVAAATGRYLELLPSCEAQAA